jgi:hypothetical protein
MWEPLPVEEVIVRRGGYCEKNGILRGKGAFVNRGSYCEDKGAIVRRMGSFDEMGPL